MSKVAQIIREKLTEIVEYSYSDGAVLFDINFCTEEERRQLSSGVILDTIARVLAESIDKETKCQR